MIALQGLTKRYGSRTAVDDVTLDVRPGVVTGLLGPNGAGKSTVLRLVVGLDAPAAGRALVLGQPYAALRHPLRQVGALLDDSGAPAGRTARAHLSALAVSNRIPRRRVDDVLETVGLTAVAGRRTSAFSLGMTQRLGIAAALLGDPAVLLLDEPVNGLDADGVRWVRTLMRSLAAEGRTVLVSSHLMSETQETADHVVVLGRGRVIADAPLRELLGPSAAGGVRVRSPRAAALAEGLRASGFAVEPAGPDALLVSGPTPAEVGDLAHRLGAPLHELSERFVSLEEAYLALTGAEREYVEDRVDGEAST